MSKYNLHPHGGAARLYANPANPLTRRILLAVGAALSASSLSLSAQELEVIETFTARGQGESRATNAIDLETLDIALPGLSPEKLVDRVPGVNVVSRDPFGFYEFGNDIRVRAFNISNLGVTLDGVPVGTSDPRYGTPIGRIVDGGNLTSIKVSQGAGDVTTPAYQALGGSLQYFSIDPDDEMGATFTATYGSFDHISLFGRVMTGEIFEGLTAYVSASHFEFSPRGLEGLAKGRARKFETKFKYELPSGDGTVKYVFSYNDRDDFDTAGLDWGEWRSLETGISAGGASSDAYAANGYIEYTPWDFPGIGTFNYGDLSDQGRNLGPPAYIDPNEEVGEGTNAQYFNLWRNGRMDWLHRVILDYNFSDQLSVKVVPYFHDKKNYGLFGRQTSFAENQIRAAYAADPTRTDIWGKPYYDATGNALDENGNIVVEYSSAHAIAAPSVGPGDPFIPGVPGRTGREEIFGGARWGVTTTFQYETEKHKLIFGGWYENDYHKTRRPNYNLQGGSITGWFEYDQFNFMNYTRNLEQDVRQFWIQDTYSMMDGRLDLIAGVKALTLERDANGFLSNTDWIANVETVRSTKYEDLFLPQVGLLYRLTDSIEIFMNYSENMATPTPGTITTAGDTFQADLLNPEYSDNFDIGLRGSAGGLSYNLQAYYIKYTDRILASAVPFADGVAAAGNSVYQNVGGVDSWGMEASADWATPIEGLKLIGSIAIQETTFQEDLFSGYSASPDTGANFRSEINPDDNPLVTGDEFSIFEELEGNDLGNTPFLTVNFDAVYKIGPWRATFGGKFFDEVYVNTWNTQPVDSYTVFEASLGFSGQEGTKLEGWSASFNIYNLFDQYFWLARSYDDSDGQVLADRGRQFTLTVKSDF